MPGRFAIYYAPARFSPLWRRAEQWLLRDQLDALGVSARHYGFHATLKAPMTLAEGVTQDELERAVEDFAAAQMPVESGPLALRWIDGFLALVPHQQSQALTAFAGEAVATFEPFRAPLSAADRAKRLHAGLNARQAQLLEMYGYPYVFEQFQFHMTLTDRIPDEARDEVIAAASDWFTKDIGSALVVDRLVLFHEAEPGAPFMRLKDFVFPETKT